MINHPLNRRTFLKFVAGGAAVDTLVASWRPSRADVGNAMPRPRRAIDCHAHVYHDGVVPGLLAAMDATGIRYANLLSVLFPGLGTLNANTLAVKAAAPERLYAFCAIDYRGMTEPGWADRAITKLETCVQAGAQGIKMLLGKPGNAVAHFRLTHPRMKPLYDWFGKQRLPVIYHVGDVPHFWDRTAVDDWSTSTEWTGMYGRYPNACLSPEQIRQQVDDVVAQHPDVRFIFAHLAMPHGSLDWLSRLLGNNENVHADLSAPCTVGFLVRRPDEARDFLEKHADRLCFGTDAIMMHTVSSVQCREKYREFASSFRSVFETAEEMNWFFSKPYRGLGLSAGALDKLLWGNFHRLAGDPKPIPNRKALDAVIDEATRDLRALKGVANDNEFSRLSEQSIAKRQRDFETRGTIADTVFEGGTVPEKFRSMSLEMFKRVRTAG